MAGYNGKHIKTISTATGKKNPFKDDVIVDPEGQWKYPGQVIKIPSGDITMKGVPYPVLGIDNLGNQQMMQPGMDYTFPGQYVTEYPQLQKGGNTKPIEYLEVPGGKISRERAAQYIKENSYPIDENIKVGAFNNPLNIPIHEQLEAIDRGKRRLQQVEEYKRLLKETPSKRVLKQEAKGGWLDAYAGGGSPSPDKARAMLEDGMAHGHPLTQKQIDFFKTILKNDDEDVDVEEFGKGGFKKAKALSRNKTSRNIKTSINFLMARNFDIYGLAGVRFYDPSAKFETGGWLDKYK